MALKETVTKSNKSPAKAEGQLVTSYEQIKAYCGSQNLGELF